MGRVHAVGYELHDAENPRPNGHYVKAVYGGADYTQRECKERAQEILNREFEKQQQG